MGGQAEAKYQQAASRAQGLPIPAARQDDRPAEPEPALAKAGVWAADVTYIPMQEGFLYLVAIIDWAARRVLSSCVRQVQQIGHGDRVLVRFQVEIGIPLFD